MAPLLMKAARVRTPHRDEKARLMMLIPCPWCGKRSELEFTHGGDASKPMPSGDQNTEAWDNWGQSKNSSNFYSDPNYLSDPNYHPNYHPNYLEAWYQYVYERPNPAGEHVEYWHHSYGCNKWFKVRRNTTTNEFSESSKP